MQMRKSMAIDVFLLRDGKSATATTSGKLELQRMTLEAFRAKWGTTGVLYRVLGSTVVVMLTSEHPVRV